MTESMDGFGDCKSEDDVILGKSRNYVCKSIDSKLEQSFKIINRYTKKDDNSKSIDYDSMNLSELVYLDAALEGVLLFDGLCEQYNNIKHTPFPLSDIYNKTIIAISKEVSAHLIKRLDEHENKLSEVNNENEAQASRIQQLKNYIRENGLEVPDEGGPYIKHDPGATILHLGASGASSPSSEYRSSVNIDGGREQPLSAAAMQKKD